jgi:hypothetical protein
VRRHKTAGNERNGGEGRKKEISALANSKAHKKGCEGMKMPGRKTRRKINKAGGDI